MAFSGMSSREKTVVAVLGVVILIALIGIGFLVARLVTGDRVADRGPEITVPPTSAAEGAPATGSEGAPTAGSEGAPAAGSEGAPAAGAEGAPGGDVAITPVPAPSLDNLDKAPPGPVSDQPEVVVRMQSTGPGAPVIIAAQPLHAGRSYRLEITAEDGSKVAIQGSWSQSATSASGKVEAPQIEFFEGTTPYEVNVVSPVPDPALWGVSASAGAKDLLGQPPVLMITIWDVTGAK
jgi:hypothetical protein